MTKDLINKFYSLNYEYYRYAGRERMHIFYHQTGTCKIYKCDNVTKGMQRIEDVDIKKKKLYYNCFG